MKKFDKIDTQKIKAALINFKDKIRKVHIIVFTVIVIIGTIGFVYGQHVWKKYSVTKGANNIIAKISQSQKNIKKEKGAYTNNLFQDSKVVSQLRLSKKIDSQKSSRNKGNGKGRNKGNSKTRSKGNSGGDTSTKKRVYQERDDNARNSSSFRSSNKTQGETTDINIGQSGDYYVEIDAENGCMIVKYRRFTTDKTTYYAFFEDGTSFCQGKNCIAETKNEDVDLCYVNGMCFPKKLIHETERSCGNDHGKQTRNCVKSCNGGTCGEWGECVCDKGYGWDGTTCKQLQTEKDCDLKECFNGVYCESPEVLEKEIENGTCTRKAACQTNKGWQYSDWDCECNGSYLCPVKDECVLMPQNVTFLDLPNEEGKCKNITHKCYKNQGWKKMANSCSCNKVGTYWNKKEGEAECSPCTQKPENAVFTSNAAFTDSCSWECLPGFDHRKNDCTKPDGQYLCATTSLQSCTDEFSKIRKMEVDKKTNEGQPCYTDMKDNILFFDKKSQVCTICQCVNVDRRN